MVYWKPTDAPDEAPPGPKWKSSHHRQRWKFRAGGGDADDNGSKLKMLPDHRLSTALHVGSTRTFNYSSSKNRFSLTREVVFQGCLWAAVLSTPMPGMIWELVFTAPMSPRVRR
jgi:hypothetical protein